MGGESQYHHLLLTLPLPWFLKNPPWHLCWFFPSPNGSVLGPFLLFSHLLRCPLFRKNTRWGRNALCNQSPDAGPTWARLVILPAREPPRAVG